MAITQIREPALKTLSIISYMLYIFDGSNIGEIFVIFDHLYLLDNNWNIYAMERRDSSLPRMIKTLASQQQPLSFKVRSNLATKEKENKIQKSVHQATAKNIIKKAKSFNSPDLIFALNDSIRLQASSVEPDYELKSIRDNSMQNKTFHGFGMLNHLQKTQSKFYAVNQEREKAIELSKWMTEKLLAIKNKKSVTLEDILDYNQTVINYGLGQIIDSVRRRCKQQGQTLKIIWDNTFLLFESLINVLAQQLKQKDQEMIKNEKQLEKIFQTNLSFAHKKNQQLEEHLDLLYEKMKKIILWNRTLRKDRFKQQIRIRVKDFRLATYTSALEEVTGMLLAESKQKDSLKLARKIISKLYRQKNLIKSQNKRKKKQNQLESQAHQHVHEKAKQFVTTWLKKYSFEDDEKIQGALYLSQDQKLQIMKITDQNEVDDVDIYDFFQTKSIKVQATTLMTEKAVQYQLSEAEAKTRSVGIQTHTTFTKHMGAQTNFENDLEDSRIVSKNPKRCLRRKFTYDNQLEGKKGKNGNKYGLKGSLSNKKININSKILEKTISIEGSQEQIEGRVDNLEEIKSIDFNETSLMDSEQFIFKEEWETKNQILDNCDPIAEMSMERIQYDDQDMKKYTTNNQISQVKFMNSPSEKLIPGTSEKNRNKIKLKDQKLKNNAFSQRFITQSDEPPTNGYKIKALKNSKFEEIYQNEMKNQYNQNKEEMIRAVVRRRSFYKNNRNRGQNGEKALMLLWYRPNKFSENRIKKQLNQIDENIYNYFGSLIKSLTLPFNYTKSKIYQQTCTLFSSVSTNLNNFQRTVPKNKQFINLSLTGITKFISRLIFDYLRKIRADFEGIYIQSQRVHYPLSVILVDHMMHKYGLKEIAEKKLKNFMEKLSNFVGVSERMNFFYRLLGVNEDLISADELIIYMKCLVYFDVKKTIPIHNISKDFSVQRASTDKETVLANVDEIIKQFFREDRRQQVKWKIERYFHTYQLTGLFDIQRIATMIIDQYINFKKEEYQNYLPIYKNCQGNFFPNLLKIIEIYSGSQALTTKYSKMVQEMFKNADLLDENYGKSISQVKFVGLCVRLGFPKIAQIKQKLELLKNEVVKTIGVTEVYSSESQEILNKIKRKYNVKISSEKQSPDYWLWTCAQIGYDIPMINAFGLLGNLRYINCQSTGS